MMRQGPVVGEVGRVVRGKYPLITLETGGVEELDVVIATGSLPGPSLLITGNIHGNEVNPCVICHRLIAWLELAIGRTDDASALRGTVVVRQL
jgi:predicted deacylase